MYDYQFTNIQPEMQQKFMDKTEKSDLMKEKENKIRNLINNI